MARAGTRSCRRFARRAVASLAAVGRHAITRRRAARARRSPPASARCSRRCAALPALGARSPARRARGFGLTVTPADFAGARTSRVLRAPRRFDLVGAARRAGRVEVRVRRRGGDVEPLDARSPRTATTRPTRARASAPPTRCGPAARTSCSCALRARRAARCACTSSPSRRARAGRAGARAARAPRRAAAGRPARRRRSSRATAWGGDRRAAARDARATARSQVAFVHHTVTANEYGPERLGRDRARRSPSTTATRTAGTTSATTSSSTATGRSSRAARAASTRPSSAPRRRATTPSSTGVAILGTHTAAPHHAEAMTAIAQLLGWKLSLHGVPDRGHGRRAVGRRRHEPLPRRAGR